MEVLEETKCYHCGEDCITQDIVVEDKHFCCSGCKTVYEILEENNLCNYYDLNQNAGLSLKSKNFKGKYDYLSSTDIEEHLLNFKSPEQNRVTFYIPSVHCSSCVWLLENFHKIKAGVIHSRLNFLKKELSLNYNPTEITLKEIVELLATLGYEPLINLENPEKKDNSKQHSLILRIGVVGFCFGNIMLLSFPEYFKLDLQNKVDATYQKFFLYLNFLLAIPVFFYGASDFLKGAYISLKENIKKTTNVLSVDIPIVLGISALFIRSTYETFVNHSSGYWDSLAGLVFFLLIGKWLQQITYSYLSFERNYKSYFPLAVKVKDHGFKNITAIQKNDILEIHHQELVPTDSLLLSEEASIDYSFVTGESRPISVSKADTIYAGGRLLSQKVDLAVIKEASKSYLAELWNNDAFKKEKISATSNFANIFSRYFTYIALALATATGIYWYNVQPNIMWPAITAVLMVACPCALTLSMPFTMNTAMGIFGRNGFFVKNQNVIQLLAEVNTITFDKTGTLTQQKNGGVRFYGPPLHEDELAWIKFLSSQSTHPLSKILSNSLDIKISNVRLSQLEEKKGLGIQGIINDRKIKIGSSVFLGQKPEKNGHVYVEIDDKYKGFYEVNSHYREGWQGVLKKLKEKFKLFLLSGDNDQERNILSSYFDATYFNQKPQDKLDFIKRLQETKLSVLMIGDGLNDAGALRQSNVGVALSEDVNAFSPACDAILDAGRFNQVQTFLTFSKTAMNVVVASFILSVVYNIIGIGMAASGVLSPLKAAIFMPLSSISVVLFAVGLTYLYAKRAKLI